MTLFTCQYLIQNMILTGLKLECSCTCKHAECHLASLFFPGSSFRSSAQPHVSHKLVIHHPCQSPIRITCRLSSSPINVLAHWFSRTSCGVTFNHNTGLVCICRHRKKKTIYLLVPFRQTQCVETHQEGKTDHVLGNFAFSVSVDNSYDHKLSCFPCSCFSCLLLLPPCSLSTF